MIKITTDAEVRSHLLPCTSFTSQSIIFIDYLLSYYIINLVLASS